MLASVRSPGSVLSPRATHSLRGCRRRIVRALSELLSCSRNIRRFGRRSGFLHRNPLVRLSMSASNTRTASTLLAWLALTTFCGPARGDTAQPPQPPTYHYTYHKQIKPLALDATQIAVRADGPATIAPALALAKIPGAKFEPHPIKGWWMVSGFPLATPERIEEIVTALAAAPGIDFASPVFLDDFGGPMFPTPSLIVGFTPGQSAQEHDAVVAAAAPAKIATRDWMPGVDVYAPESHNGLDVLRASNELAASDKTLFAEPDMVFTGTNSVIPNDPQFNQLWGLHNTGQSGGLNDFDMDIPEAWDVHAGSSAIIDVVIDNGVDLTHPDLNLAPGADFTGSPGLAGAPGNNCDSHGTAVAGCIAALRNNSQGVVGAAPGCRVASARTFVSNLSCDGSWSSQASFTVNALNWAQSSGARVTNNSNGYGFTSSSIDTAYANTFAAGLVHFASAGNNGVGSLGYPASLGSVEAVAALNRFGNRASFSQFGPGLDVSAPGVAINSTDRQGALGFSAGDYNVVDGTSFASPYASAVACLILSRNSSLSSQNVVDILNATCTDLGAAGYDTDFGWGMVNAQRALNLLAPNGDGCSSAIEATIGGYSGSLVNASNPAPASGVCGIAGANPDIYYRFVAPIDGTLTVSTCGSNDSTGIDTVLSLHPACDASAVACSDDANGGQCGGADTGTIRDSYIAYPMSAGQSILIRVSKFGASALGAYTLNIGFALPNDACASATDASAGGTYFGNLSYASNEQTFAGSCGAAQSNPDVWYVFTAPATCPGTLTVSTCGTHDAAGVNTGMDTVLSLHAACGAEPVACNDDANGGGCGSLDTSTIRDSFLTRSLGAGQSIYIRVSKFGSVASGPFRLNVAWSGVADFNGSGSISVQDIFDFLAAYFAADPHADVNGSGAITVQDIFDYLAAYFSGC